jgi:hypothetical protein
MKSVKLAGIKFYEVDESDFNTTQFKNLLNSGKAVFHHYSTGCFYYKII